MKHKVVIFVMMVIAILIVFGNMSKIIAKADDSFSLSMVKESNEILQIDNIRVIKLYGTLMIAIDDVFTNLFAEEYQSATNQTLRYNDTNLNIDIVNNIIEVPNIYHENSSSTTDNTVEIEIEQIDNVKYIPLYLISNLPGINITIDNQKIYDAQNYCNSVNAIDNEKNEHTIVIEIDSNTQNELSVEYQGQQQGALWREEALKRIEKYRKNDITLIVKNQNGRELNNATLDLKMLDNEFKFGTAIRHINTTTNNYGRISRNLFNLLGSENGFKWKWIENVGDANANSVIQYAYNNRMKIRAHCLWWDYISISNLRKLIGNQENPEEGTMSYIYDEYIHGRITLEEAEKLAKDLQTKFEQVTLQYIENEVKQYSSVNEWDVINEPIAKQYFKYYLYDRNFLNDSTFLTEENKYLSNFSDNSEYYQFLAKCFDVARNSNQNAKLVMNDYSIHGNVAEPRVQDIIKITNNVKQYTTNIDALGIQYHILNNYQYTPQSYYNQINNVLKQTGIKDAVITEYDNYKNEKLGKYKANEKKIKADYLRDTLISIYSNPNISEFCFWVYNSTTGSFVQEEWDVYEKLMKEWLNDEQTGKTASNGTYSAKLYKGDYTAKVQVNNLMTQVPITVKDNMKPVDIIINSNLEKIEVKQKPGKTQYIQNYDTLNLTGGVIAAYYDDGTVEEIPMTSNDVQITSLDNSILGYQTITVTYHGKQITLVLKVVEKSVASIEIKQLPTKTQYIQNKEELNLTGGILLVKYNNGTQEEIAMTQNDVTVSRFDNAKLGIQRIILSYLEQQIPLVLNVIDKSSESEVPVEPKTIESIQIKNLPKKLSYIKNYEQLDLTGGSIIITYSDGATEEISMTDNDVTVSKFSNNKLGKQIVSITYGEQTISFDVEIIEKSIESIEIASLPNKIAYKQNQEGQDLTGGTILVKYDDGTTQPLSMDDLNIFTDGFDNKIVGERAITVTYKAKTTTFVVNIIESVSPSIDDTVAEGKIPQTSAQTYIVSIIVLLGILAFLSGRWYLQYLKDTHKQIK